MHLSAVLIGLHILSALLIGLHILSAVLIGLGSVLCLAGDQLWGRAEQRDKPKLQF